MADLTLFTNPMSRGRIARWMLEEVGEPYAVRIARFDGSPLDELAAINPMAKVPTLVHGDAVVTETAAICAYLAETFPDAGLGAPTNTRGRADYHRWLFFAAGPVEAAVTARALDLLPPESRRGMVGYGTFDATMAALETAVAARRPWIAGDRFTAADVYVRSQIGWGLAFGSMPARPGFEGYWTELQARPAHARAAGLDDAAMKASAAG